MSDPLAGCLPWIQNDSNGTNLLKSLLMRLRLFLNEDCSVTLCDQIIASAKLVQINRWEYVINEVQYELRRCTPEFDERFETVILNNWVKDLLKRLPEDNVWEFHRVVREYRKQRKRD